MANINDYIIAYGDQSTSSMKFNEFDGLVLSELSYIKWDGIVPKQGENDSIKLGDAITELRKSGKYNSLSDDMKKLLTSVESSERFSNMEMSNFDSVNISRDEVSSSEQVKQFAAVTFTFKDASSTENQNFISFRGTDNTLEGWQEDFNMAFDIDTEAQKAAAQYVNYIGEKLDGEIRIGGHSKGGNDTCYSFLFCDDKIRDKIVKLYSYDGPGLLNDKALQNKNYGDMLKLLDGSAIAPYDSVIGLLLDENGFVFVDTNKGMVSDHDAFSWQIDVENLSFERKEQNYVSKLINSTLDELIHKMSPYTRKVLVNALWEFIYTQDVDNFDEVLDMFGEKKLGVLIDIYNSDSLNKEDKIIITATISVGLFLAAENAISLGLDEAKDWIVKKATTIIDSIDRKLKQLGDKAKTKINNFFADLRSAVISTSNYLNSWFNKNFNAGYRYASANSCVRVNTATLRHHANRLYNVNKRIANLDRRMDALYTKVGLFDIWDLLQADALTGYSWRLSRCINYLNDTANEFEAVERSISSQV